MSYNNLPDRYPDPPEEADEFWCAGIGRDAHPVDSDTSLVEMPDSEYICQCCLETKIERLQGLLK